jgi:VanZ family protein/O-antigen ligase
MTYPEYESASPRKLMWLGALLYATFVIYGSLVPLDYHALPWDEAVARFRRIPFLELGIGSRADWVANLILYIPLGYLMMGALAGRSRSLVIRSGSALLTGALLAMLAISIEFVQEFFPQRTVSLNDLYAEWLGAAIGIVLWTFTGRSLSGIWQRFELGGTRAIRASLMLYVLLYLFLSLFPYDFLLDAGEWHDHLRSGNVGWLWAGSCGLGCWAKLVVEMLAVIPFGLLLANPSGRLSLIAVASVGVVLGLTIEILQLSIASGISQGASVFSRAAGVLLGAWLPMRFTHWDRRRMRPWVRTGLVLAGVPYLASLAWLNHWFNASWLSSGTAVSRLADVRFIPFYYHYYTSEAVAVVSLVFQFGLYAPIGVGVWLWSQGSTRQGQGTWLSVLLGVLAALLIEAGKLFVVSEHSDPTNVLIAAAAAGGCHALLAWLFPARHPPRIEKMDTQVSDTDSLSRPVQLNSKPSSPARLTALMLGVAAVLSVVGYPLAWIPLLGLMLFALSAMCWRWPGSWLIVVPAALPLLDLSYLSGRLFWNEFDSLLLLVLATAYARARNNPAMPAMRWPGRLPLALYSASALMGLMVGLLPLAPLDWNAFTHYTSPYHALHAVKGLAFALAFLPLVKSEWQQDAGKFSARLAWGMTLGLTLELLYVLWERATFSGLLNFDTGYRITGSFPGMHIGGASIEAYLVLAAPFVWLWAWPRQRAWAMLVAGGLYGLSAYGVMVTFSRGGQAAFVVATLLLLAGFTRLKLKTGKQGGAGILILLVSVVAAGLVAWPIVSGKFSQSRLATIQTDIGTRTAHWQDALDILSQAGNPFYGAGAGTFPDAFYWYSSAPSRPATYAFMQENGNVYLRLGGGESLYFEQVVPIESGHTYRIQLDMRTSAKAAALTVPVCEKGMLYSFTCAWNTLKLATGDGQWRRQEIRFKADGFGPPDSVFKRPVKLSMFNQDSKSFIDVDNVALLDEGGSNLVRNGDFSSGMQAWFFSTDSHLAWHAKNLFIHVLFEQGWLGLGAFVLLLAVAGWSLLKRTGSDALALTLFVSLTAFLIVGLIDSLIDEPRLDFLFFWLLLIALVSGGRLSQPRRSSRGRRTRRSQQEDVIQN